MLFGFLFWSQGLFCGILVLLKASLCFLHDFNINYPHISVLAINKSIRNIIVYRHEIDCLKRYESMDSKYQQLLDCYIIRQISGEMKDVDQFLLDLIIVNAGLTHWMVPVLFIFLPAFSVLPNVTSFLMQNLQLFCLLHAVSTFSLSLGFTYTYSWTSTSFFGSTYTYLCSLPAASTSCLVDYCGQGWWFSSLRVAAVSLAVALAALGMTSRVTPPKTGLDERSASFLSLEYLSVKHCSELKSSCLAGSYHLFFRFKSKCLLVGFSSSCFRSILTFLYTTFPSFLFWIFLLMCWLVIGRYPSTSNAVEWKVGVHLTGKEELFWLKICAWEQVGLNLYFTCSMLQWWCSFEGECQQQLQIIIVNNYQ